MKGVLALPIIASILVLGTVLVVTSFDDASAEHFRGAAFSYIRFSGVEGESSDKDHKKWSDLASFGFDDLTKITASKEVDKATPKLLESVCKGTPTSSTGTTLVCDRTGSSNGEPDDPVEPSFETVTIEVCAGSQNNNPQCYLKYELVNAKITSYSLGGGTAEEPPTETLSLNYDEIKVTYTAYGKDGKKGGTVEYGWKVEEAES